MRLPSFTTILSILSLSLLPFLVWRHLLNIEEITRERDDLLTTALADSRVERELIHLRQELHSRLSGAFSDEPAERSEIRLVCGDAVPPQLPVPRLSTCAPDDAGILSGCASLVVRPLSEEYLKSEVATLTKLQIPDLLATTLKKLVSAQPDDLTYLSVYAAFPTASGHEFGIIYPAVHVDTDFEFSDRVWYKQPDRDTPLLITPTYEDYTTGESVRSFTSHGLASYDPGLPSDATLLVGLDIAFTKNSPSFGPYFLNALIVLLTLLTTYRFYQSSRKSFMRFYLYSIACLSAFYVGMAANSLLGGPLEETLLIDLLSLLPSGSFLIMAAQLWITRRHTHLLRDLLIWLFIEETLCITSLWLHNKLFWSLFGCFSLMRFGLAFLQVRSRYDKISLHDLSPHPSNLCAYGFAAYCLWGFAQFSLLALDAKTSFFPGLSPFLIDVWPSIEVLLSRSGSFVALMYTKSIALFFTILLFASLEAARLKEISDKPGRQPMVILDEYGMVKSTHLLPSGRILSRKNYFADEIEDEEDRKEVSLFIDTRNRLNKYLCKIPRVFDSDQWIQISLKPVESSNTVVFLDRVDTGVLKAHLDRNYLLSVQQLLAELRPSSKPSETSPSEIPLVALLGRYRSHLQQLQKRTEARLRTAERMIRIQKPKSSPRELWRILSRQLDDFSASRNHLSVRCPSDGIHSLNITLRIDQQYFQLALEHLLASLDSIIGTAETIIECRTALPILFTETADTDYLCYFLRLQGDQNWNEIAAEAAYLNIIGPRPREETPQWVSRMRAARELLGIFATTLEITINPGVEIADLSIIDHLYIVLKVRYLRSSASLPSSGTPKDDSPRAASSEHHQQDKRGA